MTYILHKLLSWKQLNDFNFWTTTSLYEHGIIALAYAVPFTSTKPKSMYKKNNPINGKIFSQHLQEEGQMKHFSA